MGKLIMSKKERDQLKIFENLANGEIKQSVAAQMLNISVRWVREKLKRYKKHGDSGLVHLSRGKPSLKKWCKEEQDITTKLLETEWKGFGPTFVAEKLNELKGIKTNKETVRQMMIAKSFWISGKRKAKHRKMRERKTMRGMLVQLDGSPHDWFEGRYSKCTLIVFIDDATSEILWLEFVNSESFSGVAGATKNYVERCGRPISFYVDYGSVFSVNLNNPERCKKTQFERIMKEMNIDVIACSISSSKRKS